MRCCSSFTGSFHWWCWWSNVGSYSPVPSHGDGLATGLIHLELSELEPPQSWVPVERGPPVLSPPPIGFYFSLLLFFFQLARVIPHL
ncbi:hypothetical protein NPIL_434751 [Nephila pilipes]|uniref:Uncharacterized protein n=1 Tax=Nephila pilipes TaxID=299642 RepID=A0A8X6M8Z5_NEPPI|nr:hypothetical protein NPIL_434751 [Nephila pilipes]